MSIRDLAISNVHFKQTHDVNVGNHVVILTKKGRFHKGNAMHFHV